MEKKERVKKPKKAKRLIVVTGALILLALGATGCTAKQTAAPAQTVITETTADPEDQFKVDIPLEIEDPTKVVETLEDGGTISTYASGETVYSTGRYGDLGKDVFDGIADMWVKWIFNDEAELRETMDSVYGSYSMKEELTQEILAMTRETQATEATKATQPTKSNTQETKGNSNNTTPTKPATTAPTQAPAQTQPASTGNQNTQPTASTNLTPEQVAELQREAEKRLQEDLSHPAKVEDGGAGDNDDWIKDNPAGKWNWD